jgi:hypothetical protein
MCNARVEQHWAIKQRCPTRGQMISIRFFPFSFNDYFLVIQWLINNGRLIIVLLSD